MLSSSQQKGNHHPHLRNKKIMTGLPRNKEKVISRLTTRMMMLMTEGKTERSNMPKRNLTPTIHPSESPNSTLYPQYHNLHHHHMRSSSKQYHHHCLMKIFRLFWLTILLGCKPKAVANGLPLVPRSPNDAALLVPLISYGTDGGRFFSEGIILPDEELSEETKLEDEDPQEATGSYRTSASGLQTLASPRTKKGLSYLSKYYSTAILNNINLNGGNASSKNVSHNANQFFGVGGGGSNARNPSTRNSSEQRFPTIRRKLSFYPSMTSHHSAFMTPWSRFVATRPTTMRLRWGK